jgi:putative tricarboxylic transport membrane protein
MDFMIQGLGLLMAPKVLLVICASSIYGLFVGSIPGLSTTLAASLLIPFTFSWTRFPPWSPS